MNKKLQWVKDCWDYHSQYISELDVAVDWGEWKSENKRCWCCGHTSKLQKCHIISKSLGGGMSPENIIPLCAQCHDHAPDVLDKNAIFQWIANQQNPLSGLGLGRYWHLSSTIEKRSKRLKATPSSEDFRHCLEKAIELAGFHFSQSNTGLKMKESTREWVINKAFDFYEEATT